MKITSGYSLENILTQFELGSSQIQDLVLICLFILKFKNYCMIAKSDMAKLYETLLTMPGMNANTKIDLKIPLRNALLLSKIIERGLLGKEMEDLSPNILDLIPPEMTSELLEIPKQILQKAGLMDMNEKLKTFAGK